MEKMFSNVVGHRVTRRQARRIIATAMLSSAGIYGAMVAYLKLIVVVAERML